MNTFRFILCLTNIFESRDIKIALLILYLPRWDVLVDDVLSGLHLYFCRHSVNRSSVLLLWREGHSKKAYCTFLPPLVTSKHSFGFSHTFKYEPLKCQLFWRNSSLKKLKIGLQTPLILKLHLAAKLRVCDVILSNLKLVTSANICRWLAIFH